MLLVLFTSSSMHAQNDTTQKVLQEVYDDVWLPFMESYRAFDIEKFKSLQSTDLTKVSIGRNTIQSKAQYFQEIEGFFNQIKQSKRQMDIAFSITSSAIGEKKVYQTGYYCIGLRNTSDEPFQPVGYGHFTVVLVQLESGWKISLDADKQIAIDATEFKNSGVVYQIEN